MDLLFVGLLCVLKHFILSQIGDSINENLEFNRFTE